MKMPIVSLNNMAMNESVAATCCYSHAHINGHSYETVLNGGTIERRIVEDVDYIEPFDKAWLTIPGDYQYGVDGYTLTQKYNETKGVWEYVIFNGDPYNTSTLIKYCDHKGEYCNYINNYVHTPIEAHVGSTVAHTAGGKNWAADHTAIRFNS